MADFHKEDIGARLVVQIKEDGSAFDLSSASVIQLKYKRRDGGTEKVFTASYASPPEGNGVGTDGKIEYSTVATTDLDEAGVYDVRPYIETSAFQGHTQKVTINVADIG